MFRIGQGYDVHRLVPGRELVLCGVKIPHSTGLLGHSDADVAVHALMDALIGALRSATSAASSRTPIRPTPGPTA